MHGIKMKIRPLLGAAVSVSVLCGVAMMMLSNASPYVTAAQAKTTKGNNLHLQGDLIKESVKVDHQNMQVSFTIKDDEGQMLDVVTRVCPLPTWAMQLVWWPSVECKAAHSPPTSSSPNARANMRASRASTPSR